LPRSLSGAAHRLAHQNIPNRNQKHTASMAGLSLLLDSAAVPVWPLSRSIDGVSDSTFRAGLDVYHYDPDLVVGQPLPVTMSSLSLKGT